MLGAIFAGIMSGAARVTITDQTVSKFRAAPATCTAGYRLTSTGKAQSSDNTATTYSDIENWVTPTSAAGANYEARATVTSGSLTSGSAGAWLALSSDRTWTRNAASAVNTCIFTLEIRDAATLTVLDTATITLTADSS